MGHRLSRIVTRTGDDGTTGLGDGTRLPKDAPRVDALGEVDELNSVVGVLLAEPLPMPTSDRLNGVQHDLRAAADLPRWPIKPVRSAVGQSGQSCA